MLRKSNNRSEAFALLRQKAEDLLLYAPATSASSYSETDKLQLIHDLEVHQIELVIQNDELRHAWAKAEVAADKYSELYDFAPAGYFTLSRNCDILEINLCGAQMLGKPRSLLVNRQFGVFVSHDTIPLFNLFLENLFNNETKEACEVVLKTHNSPPVNIYLTGLYSREKDQYYLTAADITILKKVQKALEESENNSRSLIEAIPDMMFRLSAEGVYLDYKAATEDLAYQTKSIIGLKNRDITPPEFADLVEKKTRLTLETKQMQAFEYQLQLPEKGLRQYEARMVPGAPEEVIAIVRDITERKKTETEINHKNALLLKANAEKDKFFSIIAHDLRGPFNGFLGFTQLMAEELPDMTRDEIQQIALSMRKSATNLYSLLENLLEWSMLHRGLIPFDPVSVPLARKIKETSEMIIGSAQKKEIDVIFNVPENLSVFADEHMLETLIRNLISNAVKFTPKKGTVTVSATKTEDNFIEICIRDTGIGMSKAMVDNLFVLDAHTNRKGTEGEPSTGLGLTLCKDFIEKHGGRIWVESKEANPAAGTAGGSSFYFTLT